MRAVLPQTRSNSTGLARAGAAAWSVIGIAALVLLAGWAIGRLMAVVLPFVVAMLLATLLRPVAARLERARPEAGRSPRSPRSRSRSSCSRVLLSLILPPFIARLTDLGSSLQEGVAARRLRGRRPLRPDDPRGGRPDDRRRGQAHARPRGRDRDGGHHVRRGRAREPRADRVPAFFLVKDGRRIWLGWSGWRPERRRDAVDEVGERAWTVLTAYTRGVVFVATVDAVLIGAVLLIVGVPLALPLIVLTWVAAFFPIIGAIVRGRRGGARRARRQRPDRRR